MEDLWGCILAFAIFGIPALAAIVSLLAGIFGEPPGMDDLFPPENSDDDYRY